MLRKLRLRQDRFLIKKTCKGFKTIHTRDHIHIYLLKVNNRNTKSRSEICSKLTIKTPERHQCTNNVVLVSLLLTLNILYTCSDIFIVNFENVIAGWRLSPKFFKYFEKSFLTRKFVKKVGIITSTKSVFQL